ncbi:MAG: hypothetical protein WCF67_21415 [Chitinophagaceae bacterium]
MKLHINKEKIEEKGFLGMGKTKSWWVVKVNFELNDEERKALKENRKLLDYVPIEHHWTSKNLPQNNTIRSLTGTVGASYCADNNAELISLENVITEVARKFKEHLLSLSQAKGGSSTVEL